MGYGHGRMKPRGDQYLGGGWNDSDFLQLIQDGWKDQPVRDEPCFIADGDGSGRGSPEVSDPSIAERILQAFEDFPLRILG
jgi:hypothetical protein